MAPKKKTAKTSTPRKNTKRTQTSEQSGTDHQYRAEDITVLEGLEPVRRRPGMYIGTTGPDGLHHLIWEVFDNARDEAMGGYADDIEVALLPGGRVRVTDNGRGIPVDKHKQSGVSALETIMTTLHAGGKFGGGGYTVSGGLHGVGVSVVNALSTYMKAVVHRDGGVHVQEYTKGKRKAAVKKTGSSDHSGTIITFEPDAEVFETTELDWQRIVAHLRQQAYLVKGLRISVIDARAHTGTIPADDVLYLRDAGLEVPSMTFYFEGGLRSLVTFYNEHQKPLHKNVFYVERDHGTVNVEIALQYVDDISSRLVAFANNTYNAEGGTHVTGFKTALTRTLNAYAKKNKLTKEGEDSFTGDDVLEGLTAVVSVKMPEVQFEGQTKGKLGSVEARSAVEAVCAEHLATFLEEHPDDARAMINKAVLALRARKAAKAAKDSVLRKGALEGLTLPGKLSDCQSRDPSESELFIVEGDSAGGSAKSGRDRRTQAILPLKGKILNVERARLDRMLGSAEIKALVVALGTGIGESFDIEKLRYHRLIIATDADVDGAHIRTLLLTLFYRYFPQIIEGGFLYIAKPPLYKIRQGKKVTYAYTEDEKTEITGTADVSVEEVEEGEVDNPVDTEAKKGAKMLIQRYKGLGEMDAEELWETTMNPEHRVLKQVTVADAREADKVFDILMGTDVPSRKSFIQSNAKTANLDI